jgi:ankyrin repeat protein
MQQAPENLERVFIYKGYSIQGMIVSFDKTRSKVSRICILIPETLWNIEDVAEICRKISTEYEGVADLSIKATYEKMVYISLCSRLTRLKGPHVTPISRYKQIDETCQSVSFAEKDDLTRELVSPAESPKGWYEKVYGEEVLLFTALNGTTDKVLFKKKASIDNKSNQFISIIEAIKKDDISALQSFIVLGTDLNVVDEHGFTLLMYACYLNRFTCAELLLNNGASPTNKENDLLSPLFISINTGNPSLVNLLLRFGASADEKIGCRISSDSYLFRLTSITDDNLTSVLDSFCGEHVLIYAIKTCQTDCVKELLKYGSSLSVLSKDGETPLSLARKKKSSSIEIVLNQFIRERLVK